MMILKHETKANTNKCKFLNYFFDLGRTLHLPVCQLTNSYTAINLLLKFNKNVQLKLISSAGRNLNQIKLSAPAELDIYCAVLNSANKLEINC